jgi:hypothetical protein
LHSTGPVLRFDRLYVPKRVDASATANGTGEEWSFEKVENFKPVLLLNQLRKEHPVHSRVSHLFINFSLQHFDTVITFGILLCCALVGE